MFKQCDCKTTKNVNCKSNGAHTRQHEDHIHNVCGSHLKQENPTFINCDTARKVPNPENLAVEQPQLIKVPDTKRQEALARIKEQLNMPKPDNSPIRVMVTGHKILPNEKHVQEVLSGILEEFINTYGKHRIIAVCGGALGTDRQWALAAYKLDVPFEVYIPNGYEHVFIALPQYNNKNAEDRAKDQANFAKMLELASAVYDEHGEPRPANGRYVRGANMVRNTTMVNVSQHFIAVSTLDPKEVIAKPNLKGGTNDAIRKIKQAGVTEMIWVPANVTDIKLSKRVHI